MKKYFLKQTHTDFRVLFGIVFLICLALALIVSFRTRFMHLGMIVFLIAVLILCWYGSKLFNSFGLYITETKSYYKKFKNHSIDLKSIYAIKIINSEIDGKYGRRPIKDIHGNNMYSMIFLSGIAEHMYNYKFGDIMFMHEFRKHILFHTIFNDDFLKHIKEYHPNVIVIK